MHEEISSQWANYSHQLLLPLFPCFSSPETRKESPFFAIVSRFTICISIQYLEKKKDSLKTNNNFYIMELS